MRRAAETRWPGRALIAQTIFAALGYYALAQLAALFAAYAAVGSSPIWPASGLAVGVLLIWGHRLWVGIALGVLAAEISLYGLGDSWSAVVLTLSISAVATAAKSVSLYLIDRLNGRRYFLDRVGDVSRFVAVGALLGQLPAALLCPMLLCLFGAAPWSLYPKIAALWWVGDAFGVIILTPLIVAWHRDAKRLLDQLRERFFEAVGLVALVLALGAIAAGEGQAVEFMLLPPIIWAAFRFTAVGVTTLVLIEIVLALLGFVQGHGPLAQPSVQELVLFQCLIAVMVLTALILSAVAREIEAARLGLREANASLERNVAERTRELHDQWRLLEEMLANMSVGMAMYDAGHRLRVCNTRMMEIFSAAPDVLVTGTKWEDMATTLMARGVFVPGQVLSYGEGVDEIDLNDGRVIQIHRNPMPDGGQIRTYLDVTVDRLRERELIAARAQADAAAQAKSEFLANMSHEIRTPVNAIAGFTSLALRTELTPKQGGYLERVHAATQGLLRVINDLLDFSKIEAGHLEMERIPFRLADVIESVMSFIGPLADSKGLRRLISVAPDVPKHLIGDPFRLSQVLSNLCSNAVKFTERGEIELRVDLDIDEGGTARLLFAVRDTGVGLSEAQAAKLFQPFTQADSSTTRKFGGTGLGLVISQRLAGMMNGRIWLESQPGVGTTFFLLVELPAAAATDVDQPSEMESRQGWSASAREPRPASHLRPSRLAGARLLLVEDNPINQELAQELLEQEGAEVQIAGGGCAALAILEAAGVDSFDAALIDLQMPDMDGFETTRRIRLLPGAERLPLIAMTAHAMVEDRERCLAAGMQDHIAKPIDPDLLPEKLAHWIGPELLARARTRTPRERAAAREASERLPDRLPGIDIATALGNCAGDEQHLRGLLAGFGRSYAAAAFDIRRLCAAGNDVEAGRLAETIRHAAQELGMTDVAASAAALAHALATPAKAADDAR